MNRSTGSYESVVAPPGGVVVNIGDAMQFWTSDELVANVRKLEEIKHSFIIIVMNVFCVLFAYYLAC